MAHTSGPWIRGKELSDINIVYGCNHRVAQALYWTGSENVGEVEANAELIARAPELQETADKFEKLAYSEAMELVRLAAENDDLREALEIEAKDVKLLFITEEKAKSDRRLGLLKDIEWIPDIDQEGLRYCPKCGEYEENGHADDCELAEELK